MRKLFILTWLLLFILPPIISADTNTVQPQETDTEELEIIKGPPDLAELLPRVMDLSDRIANMKIQFMAMPDLSLVQIGFNQSQKKIEAIEERLQTLKLLKTYSARQYSSIEFDLNNEAALFKDKILDLSAMIAELEALESFWENEKQQWEIWKPFILQDEKMSEGFSLVLSTAEENCVTALDMISEKIKPAIMAQSQAVEISILIVNIRSDMVRAGMQVQVDPLKHETPPMLSSRYFKDFDRWMIDEIELGLENIDIPLAKILDRDKHLIGLQFLTAFMLIVLVRRHRVKLGQMSQEHIYPKRPFSAGIFVSTTLVTPFYTSSEPFLSLLMVIMAGFSAARLISGYLTRKWMVPFFYGLITVMVVTLLLPVLSIPLPLTRLFVFSIAMLGFGLALKYVFSAYRSKTIKWFTWFVGICAIVLGLVVLLEAVGNSDLSRHLFYSLVDTIFLLLVGLMLMLMVRDFVKLIVRSRTLQRFEYVRSGTDAVITRIVQISRVIIVFTMACYILEAWLRAESAVAVMEMVFSWGVSLGGLRIDIGLVVIIVVCLYSAIIISYIVQAVLSETTLKDDSIEHGVRVSIFKIIHYAFVFIGLMLALMVLGVNWQSITIIGGALGVGIGFGLQEIVKNFIAGLILLFERPIKVGDYVTIEGQWGEIKRLGLRSTVVQVFNRSEIVVPNHDLIDQKVTNWTLSDRLMRIIIEVGVAYGSDVEMVMTVLKECAMASSKVTRMPEPQAVFMKFGESSLDFELRVWITNIDEYVFVTSFLHQEIDKRFRKAGITIAFPQRDLHIRSMEAPSET